MLIGNEWWAEKGDIVYTALQSTIQTHLFKQICELIVPITPKWLNVGERAYLIGT